MRSADGKTDARVGFISELSVPAREEECGEGRGIEAWPRDSSPPTA